MEKNRVLTRPAYLMPWEPKLSLRNLMDIQRRKVGGAKENRDILASRATTNFSLWDTPSQTALFRGNIKTDGHLGFGSATVPSLLTLSLYSLKSTVTTQPITLHRTGLSSLQP